MSQHTSIASPTGAHNSQAKWLFWFDGVWSDTNPQITGPQNHAFWMSTSVFDGARGIKACVPDLDLHCERVVQSAHKLMMAPKIAAKEIEALCIEGVKRMGPNAELYIRPMFYIADGFLMPEAASTTFVLAIHDAPMPPADATISVCLSSCVRPLPSMAPTDAKASCLYPNTQRAIAEAMQRGYQNAVVLDAFGDVAELASSNLFYVKNGIAFTPKPNGTFLAGITRARVMSLLREEGIEVREERVTVDDLHGADELFSTGNFGKVMPIVKFEQTSYAVGPIATLAKRKYMAYAQRFSVFEMEPA
jgi:branched-chain amino acid aminotransferase